MGRRDKICQGISKNHRGIEVAPYFAPLTAKRDGYNCLVLDVFDRPSLLVRATVDPNIPKDSLKLLEDVDFVGSATEIADLVPIADHGTFDYIVSSHNFEHLPNPIRFLQGCEKVLKPGGVLSMAVPDGRVCFDFFRPHTTLIDWLEALKEMRQRPTARQVFALSANSGGLVRGGKSVGAFCLDDSVPAVAVTADLAGAYQRWVNPDAAESYPDVHCSVMTPASLELMITECRYLGLIGLEIEEISATKGCEFFVRLVNRADATHKAATVADFNATRTRLLHKIWDERAQASCWGQERAATPRVLRSAARLRNVVVTRAKASLRAARKDPVEWGRRQMRRIVAIR
jgi:hypothetical protein